MSDSSDYDTDVEDEFPDTLFSICLSKKELNKVVIKKDMVSIKCEFLCYCYKNSPRITEFYICKKENCSITNRDLINCLVDNKFETLCNHTFLEFFEMDTPCQVSPWFGS